MTQINSATSTSSAATAEKGNSIETLDLDVFLTLMLQELQNQDPLDPMDNQQLLDQIGQIREISSSDKLTETLDSVLLGQNVATATSLIGTEVEGITDGGRRVVGAVQEIVITDGEPLLTLATEPASQGGVTSGSIEEGFYEYEVVWEVDDTNFSISISADTDTFDEFDGSIRLDNLPKTDDGVLKKVYRTDKSGTGEKKLIGTLQGNTSAFTDQKRDDERSAEVIPVNRQVLRFADSAEVRLSNISTVEALR